MTLRQHKRWTDMCDNKEKAIRALTIVSIGVVTVVAKKARSVDTFEVQFSNKESLWLSHDNIRALNVKQWARALDKDKAAPVEEKDEVKEQPQLTPEQQKVVEMEEKLKGGASAACAGTSAAPRSGEQTAAAISGTRERARRTATAAPAAQRDRARETAQLLEKLRGLSARMDNELRQEVLQLMRALQGKQSEESTEERKEAPQPQAAAEEVKEAPPEAAEEDAEDDAAEDAAAEDDAAEDDAGDDAAEDDVAATTPPIAIGSKRKEVRGTANAGKKQRR